MIIKNMCRIGSIKSKNYIHPSLALKLMRSQQKGHDNSGFAFVAQDLGGIFENYKNLPILSMACSDEGMKYAEDLLHSIGFTRVFQYNMEVFPDPSLVIETMPNYVFEVFYIETDSVQPIEYRITYLKSIPEYQLNDRLYFSEKIISVLEDGICSKLCLRYKLLDVKPIFDEEFANGVRLLKRTNNANRPMTYEGFGGSYLDNFYNGFAPNQW